MPISYGEKLTNVTSVCIKFHFQPLCATLAATPETDLAYEAERLGTKKGGILMNAYLIAAKANAWEVSQHVGYAIEANQPEYLTDAQGRGAGCDLRMKRKIMARPHLLKDILRMSQQSLA